MLHVEISNQLTKNSKMTHLITSKKNCKICIVVTFIHDPILKICVWKVFFLLQNVIIIWKCSYKTLDDVIWLSLWGWVQYQFGFEPEFEKLGLKTFFCCFITDIENPRIEKLNLWFTLADPSFGAGVNREYFS